MTQYVRLTDASTNPTSSNYCKEWFGEKCSDNKDGRGNNKGNYCHWNNYISCGPLEGCFCDCDNEFETIKSDLEDYNSTVVTPATLSQINEQFIWGHTSVLYSDKCVIPSGTTMLPNFNSVTTSIMETGTQPLYVKSCMEFTLTIGWPFTKTFSWNECVPQVPDTPTPHCDNISNCRKPKPTKATNEQHIYEIKDSNGTVIKTDFNIFNIYNEREDGTFDFRILNQEKLMVGGVPNSNNKTQFYLSIPTIDGPIFNWPMTMDTLDNITCTLINKKTTTKPVKKKKAIDWNRKDACEKEGNKLGEPCSCITVGWPFNTTIGGTYVLNKGACKCSCSV